MPNKPEEHTWYGDAWEGLKKAPGQLYDRFLAPTPRISFDANGKPFVPPKPNAQGQIRSIVKNGKEVSPYPEVSLSGKAMWKNFHPIDFGLGFLKAVPDMPQVLPAMRALERGYNLIQAQEKFNQYKASHPGVPDQKNPFYISPDQYRKMRQENENNTQTLTSAFGGPFAALGLVGVGQKYDPAVEMKRDMYIARRAASAFTYVDKNGKSHTDWNHLTDEINRNPEAVITTLVPLFGQANRFKSVAQLTSALSDLERAGGVTGALAKVVRATPRVAMIAADPINQFVLPKVAGATVRAGIRMTGAGRPDIYNPDFAKAWKEYLDTHAPDPRTPEGEARTRQEFFDDFNQKWEDELDSYGNSYDWDDPNVTNFFNKKYVNDLKNAWSAHLKEQKKNATGQTAAIQEQLFDQFQKDTGGQYGQIFNQETLAAMRAAGIDPSTITRPSQWLAIEKNLGRTGQVVTPAGIREAVAKAGGAGTVTRSTATGESPSYLWGKAGYEQKARQGAIGDVNTNLQSQMGITVDPNTGQPVSLASRVAEHAVDSVLGGGFAGPQTFKSKAFGHEYTYDPVADTFTFDRGSSYVAAPGKSRYVTIDSSNPQFNVLKGEAGNLGTSAAVQAAIKSRNPVFKKIGTEYKGGITNRDELVEAVTPMIENHILDQNGAIVAGGADSLPGQLNYQTLRSGLHPEGQQVLDDFLRQRLTLANNPRAAQQSLGVLQGKNPDLFNPDELANFNTGMNARGVVETPMPDISAGQSLIRKAKEKILPNASASALIGYVLGGGNPLHAAALAGGNLAWNAAESAVSPLGLSDRFGAPVALNPQNWYAPGTRAIAPVTAPAITARGIGNIMNYGNQYDENMRVSALPKPQPAPPPPSPIVSTATDSAGKPSAQAPAYDYWGVGPNSSEQSQPAPQGSLSGQGSNDYWGVGNQEDQSGEPQNRGGRIGYKKGGAVNKNIEHLVQGLMARYKAVKKSQDNGTKPLLEQPDQAIVKALSVANKAI